MKPQCPRHRAEACTRPLKEVRVARRAPTGRGQQQVTQHWEHRGTTTLGPRGPAVAIWPTRTFSHVPGHVGEWAQWSQEKTTRKTAQCGWTVGRTHKSREVHPRSCALRAGLHPHRGIPGGSFPSLQRRRRLRRPGGQGFPEGAEEGGPRWGRSVWTPTLVVQLLQVRQVAQDGHAVEVGVGTAARVLGQPQHPQARQALQVGQLGQAGDAVLPQVELAQLPALAHGLQGRHAVDAAKTAR